MKSDTHATEHLCRPRRSFQPALILPLITLSVLGAAWIAWTVTGRPWIQGQTHLKLESVRSEKATQQTYYIIAIEDEFGNQLLTAADLSDPNPRSDQPKLVNDGHGLWFNLPAHGERFELEWSGDLNLARGTRIYARAGKSKPGSLLRSTVDGTSLETNIANIKGISPIRIYLGETGGCSKWTIAGIWVVLSLSLFVASYVICAVFKAVVARRHLSPHPKGHDLSKTESVSAAAGLATTLSLFLPLYVYYLNRESMDIPFYEILGGALPVVFLVAALLSMLALLPKIGEKVSRICGGLTLIFFTLAVLCPNWTGEMTGMGTFSGEQGDLWPTIKFALLTTIVLVLSRRRPDLYRFCWKLSAALSVLLSIVITLSQGGLSQHKERGNTTLAPPEYFSELGSETNIIVLVLDGFSGQTAREAIQSNPELRDDLQGFQLYPLAIAPALNTPAGLCAILTGNIESVYGGTPGRACTTRVLENSFLGPAQKSGYAPGYVSIMQPANMDAFPAFNEQYFFTTPEQSAATSFWRYAGFLRLASFRILPPFIPELASSQLRPTASMDDWEIYEALDSPAERAPIAAKMAFNHLLNELRIGGERRKLLFWHSKVTHPPLSFSSTGQYRANAASSQTSQYALSLVVSLTEKLASMNLLDRTLLIVVSDHGQMGVQDRSFGGSIPPATHFDTGFNPLVMIRAPKRAAPYEESTMTVWLGDIHATVLDFIGAHGPEKSENRSLLSPSSLNRTLSLSLFMRPDHSSFHAPLAEWIPIKIENGRFADFAIASSFDLAKTMKTKPVVSVSVGTDPFKAALVEKGSANTPDVPKHILITTDKRTAVKKRTGGVVIIKPSPDGYASISESDPKKIRSLLAQITTQQPVIVAGLAVQAGSLPESFRDELGAGAPTETLNFIYITPPSSTEKRIRKIGSRDINASTVWR